MASTRTASARCWPACPDPLDRPRGTDRAEGLAAAQGPGGVDLVGLDHVDDPALRADRVRVVTTDVLAGQLVDVVARLLAVDRLDYVAAHLGPVPRVLRRVQQHRYPRVAADVSAPLPLRLGVHQDVLAIGV